MFDAATSQQEFLDKAAKLDPFKIGLLATADDLEGRAAYIRQFAKLAANHIESLMADASASTTHYGIDEEDARAIEDAGADCSGQLMRAAACICEAA